MAKQMEVTYVLNSGFILELGGLAIGFDLYRDTARLADVAIRRNRHTYLFASHAHFDHFDPKIASHAAGVERYFLGFDIEREKMAEQIPADQRMFLHAGDTFADSSIRVTAYGSTDEGVSFYVEAGGWRIFHAGDLNWWHWKGDTQENNTLMKNGFMKQMKKLDGLKIDVAFFPVDARLEEFWDIGAKEFCRRTDTANLVTMHNVRGKTWYPPQDFFERGKEIPVWTPNQTGESIKIFK